MGIIAELTTFDTLTAEATAAEVRALLKENVP
jgi:hypothetical protein